METAVKAPKLEVKKVRSFMGNEGYGFNAELWIDGRKAAFVIDDANGGCFSYQGLSREDDKRLSEYVDSLPPVPADDEDDKPLKKDLDWVVSDLVDAFELDKKLRSWCKTSIVVKVPGSKKGSYLQIKAALTPEKRAEIVAKHPGCEILNDLVGIAPSADALAADELRWLKRACKTKTVVRTPKGLVSYRGLPDARLRAVIANKFPGCEIVNDTLAGIAPPVASKPEAAPSEAPKATKAIKAGAKAPKAKGPKADKTPLQRFSTLDLDGVPSDKPVVTWKHEGAKGPSFTCASGRFKAFMEPRSFGAPRPEGVTDNGWISRAAAEKIARSLGAAFVEF